MTFAVGEKVTNDRPFVSPIGASFAPGESFSVEIVGVSTRCRHDRTGSVVWVQGSRMGCFFLAKP